MTDTAETNPDEYNGWVNRETWAAALHLSNEEGLYRVCLQLVADAPSIMAAGEAVESFVTESAELVYFPQPGDPTPPAEWVRLMLSDVGSLWRVDWQAVAGSFLDD